MFVAKNTSSLHATIYGKKKKKNFSKKAISYQTLRRALVADVFFFSKIG